MAHKSINEIILETVGKGSFNEKGIYTISVSARLFYLHIISVTSYNHPHPILGAASTTCSTLIQIYQSLGFLTWLKQFSPDFQSSGMSPDLILIWCDPSWRAFILKSMMCLLLCLLCQARWVIDILAEVKIVRQTNCVPDTKMTSWLAGLTWSFSGGIWECGILPGSSCNQWHTWDTT